MTKTRTKKGKRRERIFQLLGIGLFGYIVYQIGPLRVLYEIRHVKIHLVLLTTLSVVFITLLQALRWQRLLKVLGIHIHWLQALNFFWIGMFIGTVTPGKIGDFAKVYFLQKQTPSTFRALFSVLADRMIDVLVLLCCAVVTALFFLKAIGIYVFILSLFWLSVFTFIMFLMNKGSYIHRLFARFIKKVVPAGFEDFDRLSFEKVWAGINLTSGFDKLLIGGLIITSWIGYFLSKYFLALSLNIDISFWEVFFCVSASTVVTFLPISVSGIGTRDAAMIFMFSQLELAKELALAFSLLILAVDLFVISFGIIPYFMETSRIRNQVRRTISKERFMVE